MTGDDQIKKMAQKLVDFINETLPLLDPSKKGQKLSLEQPVTAVILLAVATQLVQLERRVEALEAALEAAWRP